MAVVALTVLVGPFVLFVVEALLSRRGVTLPNPDVATLTDVRTPASPHGDVRLLWLGDSTAAAVGTSAPRYSVSSALGEMLSDACGLTVYTRVIAKSGKLPLAQKRNR